jgi:hypothetical protein
MTLLFTPVWQEELAPNSVTFSTRIFLPRLREGQSRTYLYEQITMDI